MAKRIVDEEMRFSIVVNGDDAQKELFDLEKSTRELTQSNKDLRAEKNRLKAAGQTESAEYKRITAAMKENNAAIKSNKARMAELQDQIGLTGLTMRQLSQRASQLRLQLMNMVPGSAEYKRLEADLEAVDARLRELRTGARATQLSLGSIADGFNRYFAMVASVIAAGTGVVLSIQKVIDYNGKLSDSQADVMKTTGMTKEEVDDLTRSFGLMKTRTARIELLKLAEDAGRLGITGVKNLQEFVKVANQMKVALGDDLSDEAIREVGKMTNVYEVGAETGRDYAGSMMALGSAINEVSASGANQAGFLVDYLKRQAGVAAQTKISAAENIGYAATFDEIGQSVEVSATAMNKIWMDMFENVSTYAKIAGMELNEFTVLLNTDANEAMIRFLEGLNGNNEGMSIMIEKLGDLEAGGARGVAALSSLANNTDLLRQRQVTANSALQEASSLTDEYNVKNNNLAATIDKVKKKMVGWFSSGPIISGLNSFINGFAKMIGATEDLDRAFRNETRSSYESARAMIAAANSSSKLLDEYESLTAEGVVPTEEAKKRLEEITLLLKDRLGESVVAIDAETGALKLNTEAVKEQIKLKRLAADEEASTLVSRLKGTEEEKKRLKEDLPALQREYDIRKRLADQAKQQFRESDEYQKKTQRGRLGAMAELDEVKKEREAFNALNQLKTQINEQDERRLDILERLKELNFSEDDVDLMFSTNDPDDPAGPKEGDTKVIEGMLFIFKNGKWVPQKITGPGGGGPENEVYNVNAKKEAEALRRIQEENDRLKATLINESFQKEIALSEANHQAKLAKIREQMIEEAEIRKLDVEIEKAKSSGDTARVDELARTKEIWIQRNRELNQQIQYEEEVHQNELGAIIQRGLQEDIQEKQAAFERERVARQTAHNLELAALGNNERAKQDLQERFNQEETEREADHLQGLIKEMNAIIKGGEFEGFNLELLSDEEKQELLDFIAQANLEFSELLNKINSLGGGGSAEGSRIDADVDILGFTIEQWDQTFEKLDTAEQKIEAAALAVGALQNAWGMFADFQHRRMQVEMQEFERTQEEKRESLARNLDAGYINQRQYNKAVDELEKESRKKRAEMEYKQAKREKEMAIASIVMNTAIGVSKALAQGGLILGVPWAAIVGALGAAQLALAMATPLPAKGYEDGLYPVKREQDGKVFNARNGGKTKSGVVSKPTVFMAGEVGPEMVIDNRAWAKMDPDVKNSLYRELGRMGRVPGYEGGYYPEMRPVRNNEPESTATLAVLERNTIIMARPAEVLDRIEKQGIQAHLLRSMENAKKIQDDIDDYNKLRNANKR